MKKYYDILGLNIDASQKEIEEAYNKLSVELNPKNNNNEDFFKVEYLKIVDAYNAISNKSKLGTTNTVSSNRISDAEINQDNSDEEFITVKISKNNLKNASKESAVKDKSFGRFFTYDDEYISGWSYLLRSLLNTMLTGFLIGIYLQSVTAYKRSNSLGSSSASIWGFWGAFLIPGLFIGNNIDTELYTFIFIFFQLPHWYLWFSNGKKS